MIRQPTIIAFSLCALLGIGLFLVKYDVQALEEELVKVDRDAAADQEAIHVLKAEWSFLTQPARLADLAARHLVLHPLTANQIGDVDQLALRADRPAPVQTAQVQTTQSQAAQSQGPVQVATIPAAEPQPAALKPAPRQVASAVADVPISAVLKAMQLADYKPAGTTAAKPRRTP
jgi:hypothetical protein